MLPWVAPAETCDHEDHRQAQDEEQDLQPAADAELPFVVALEEDRRHQGQDEEGREEGDVAEQSDRLQELGDLVRMDVLDEGADPGELVAGEGHLHAGAQPAAQRRGEVGEAHDPVGALVEVLVAHFGRRELREIDAALAEEGAGAADAPLRR